jgi:hypothetical protein
MKINLPCINCLCMSCNKFSKCIECVGCTCGYTYECEEYERKDDDK